MKLDPTVMRAMNRQDFRVMEAIEQGMANHEVVPLPLITALAKLRHGGAHKIISSLLRDKLLSHERKRGGHDGYRLTTAGYDVLALHHLKTRGVVAALGQRIGTGKESDIYLAADPEGTQIVVKLHRLGRNSFRNVKNKRDYLTNKSSKKNRQQTAHSWLFLSRLSALREFAFMKALHGVQYPTPTPIAHNRHIVAMTLVRGVPLYQVFPKQLSAAQAKSIYDQSCRMAVRLARHHGLVHCDLNEFNLLVDLSGIQSLATNDTEDPYVRNSGQSVMSRSKLHGIDQDHNGTLSKPAWLQTLEEKEDIALNNSLQDTLPEPIARLDDGEPRPVVTLIDFPQMISTNHPNAAEYYGRDLACLHRFFELKLQCQIPAEERAANEWNQIMRKSQSRSSSDDDEMTADELISAVSINDERANVTLSDDDDEDACEDAEDGAFQMQTRLDAQLQASGFSSSDRALSRDLELYYFQSGPQPIGSAVIEEEEDSEDEEDESEDSNDFGNCDAKDVNDASIDNQAEENDSDSIEQNIQDLEEKEKKPEKSVVCVMDLVTAADNDTINNNKLTMDEILSVSAMSRKQRHASIKERVQKQMENQKRKSRTKGALRSTKRNSNKKCDVRGKRLLADHF